MSPWKVARFKSVSLIASGFAKFAFSNDIAACRSAGESELINCSVDGVGLAAAGGGEADGVGFGVVETVGCCPNARPVMARPRNKPGKQKRHILTSSNRSLDQSNITTIMTT